MPVSDFLPYDPFEWEHDETPDERDERIMDALYSDLSQLNTVADFERIADE